jgi:hypothetical protein
MMGSAPRTDVSVLYVDPLGPYPKLVADWWDEKRDAKLYAGPNPVVAHPPCGPWGRLAKFCHLQDASCGPLAVEQVRQWGGVLEHPADSRLWAHCGLPMTSVGGDGYGFSLAVEQVSWGHLCRKPTWIYCVGVDRGLAVASLRTGGRPSHACRKRPGEVATLLMASKEQRRRTPVAFAEWLVQLAASASRCHAHPPATPPNPPLPPNPPSRNNRAGT